MLKFYLNRSSVLVREKFALQGVPNIKYRTMNDKSTNIYSIPLVVNGSLDYEEENVYIIWLAVEDPGGKMAFERFQIEVTDVNEAPTDILMSENFVAENSPASTVIGKFLVKDPDVKSVPPQIHICSLENSRGGDEDEFYITHETDHNFLRVKYNSLLDFEERNVYNINVTCKDAAGLDISKSFKVSITDVNEEPTSICLVAPRSGEDCSVVGEIFIEDLDYPQIQCGLNWTVDLQPYSEKLSEYTCQIKKEEDTLSEITKVISHFYVHDSPPRLHVKKSIFIHGNLSYNVPISCESTLHPRHTLSKNLVVHIQVPNDDNCRDKKLCASCPQPKFCLSNVKAAGKCIDTEYLLNLTVDAPPSLFKKRGFIKVFEHYVKDLIEGTEKEKSLKDLIKEKEDNDIASRKQRGVSNRTVYVELLLYVKEGTFTKVVLAIAEKPNYKLIPAFEASVLLNKVLHLYTSSKTSISLQWIIVVCFVVFICIICLIRKWRRQHLRHGENLPERKPS
ncbi:uncharacterized protein LOC124449484 isoform X2 [Xenia sp. Carnegie-2017]|uniref:uncharacterized protein LOC124449484 isoform X2 n=1 Tax=Xenia sp. Carnegie-2017 TaxID=2897299 RepID=UPI001F040E42|nr:uncharacterized protein LOC124449484 isoform X2 [Xenia sp. Carnegie-2017]